MSEGEGVIYRMLADLVVVFHGVFILFAAGGVVAVHFRPKLIWLHVPCVIWAFWIETAGGICPLTPLENLLRERSGIGGYPGGFVEHYLLPLIYPDGLTRPIQILLGVLVLSVNLAGYGRLIQKMRKEKNIVRTEGEPIRPFKDL